MLMALGHRHLDAHDFDEAAPAFDSCEKAKDDGQIRRFTGNDYFDDLSNGTSPPASAGPATSRQLAKDNPDVRFVIPETGRDCVGRHDGASRRAPTNRRRGGAVDELRLRPGAGGADHGVGRSTCHRSKGCRTELAEDRPPSSPTTRCSSRTRRPWPTPKSFAKLPEDVEAEYDAAFSAITGA